MPSLLRRNGRVVEFIGFPRYLLDGYHYGGTSNCEAAVRSRGEALRWLPKECQDHSALDAVRQNGLALR